MFFSDFWVKSYFHLCLTTPKLSLQRDFKEQRKIRQMQLGIGWLMDHDIDLLPKDDNPPNVPQVQPIERFWAILKNRIPIPTISLLKPKKSCLIISVKLLQLYLYHYLKIFSRIWRRSARPVEKVLKCLIKPLKAIKAFKNQMCNQK